MKKFIPIIILAFCFTFVTETNAQLSKKEVRAWKKKLKKLKPESYKELIDDNTNLRSQVGNLKAELNKMDSQLAEKNQQISVSKSQMKDLKSELSSRQNSKNSTRKNSTNSRIDENKGIIFKVQIGAFKQKDLSSYDNSENFSAESSNGIQKYTLGVFKDYWKADTFKKYLREMGVKDAWVVSYKNGKRIPVKEVLEGVSKS